MEYLLPLISYKEKAKNVIPNNVDIESVRLRINIIKTILLSAIRNIKYACVTLLQSRFFLYENVHHIYASNFFLLYHTHKSIFTFEYNISYTKYIFTYKPYTKKKKQK